MYNTRYFCNRYDQYRITSKSKHQKIDMKKLSLIFLILTISISVFSQNNKIESTGNVGIGTTSPSVDLEIAPTTHRPVIWLNSRGTGNSLNTDIFMGDNGNKRWSITHRPYDFGNDFVIWRNNSGWSKAFSIDYSTGRIGIGTMTPTMQLDVNGSARIGNLDNRQYLKISSTEWPEVRFETPSSDEQIRLGVAHSNHTGFGIEAGDFYVYTQTVGQMPFILRKNGDLRFNLKGGSVGIGTATTGSHKLAVEGSIGAREIKVTASGWSDFVFKKDYKLPTLEEVEEHINENGHLPEIPNEAEVKENGINLGEMNAKLLQKIEELTLYMIDLNKQVQQLKVENEELKSKIED